MLIMKQIFFTGLILSSCLSSLCAANSITDVRINKDNKKLLNQFEFIDSDTDIHQQIDRDNMLIAEKSSSDSDFEYLRYQQYYKGLEVVGRSVVAHRPINEKNNPNIAFTGMLTKGLKLDIDPYYLSENYRDEITQFAQKDYQANYTSSSTTITDIDTQPIIWIDEEEDKATLAYTVSFRDNQNSISESWPHYIISATKKEIVHHWNNIQTVHAENGPGGNLKTGRYQYGQAGIPSLPTTMQNNRCYLANEKIRIVNAYNLSSILNPSNPLAINHPCGQNNGDPSNGAWSPANDAYLFGNMIVDMYRSWYGQSILTNSNGSPRQIILIVHYRQNYENAGWNGRYMLFGDGHTDYHPLVSLDVVAHEFAHAFTTSNSNLLYFNQSGAINEAFSDMSAIAAEYYLRQNYQQTYQTIYAKPTLDWQIGDRIAKGNYALRSLSQPARFGDADCELRGNGCRRTWSDILRLSRQQRYNEQQNFIVHSASGIFNRAFYEMVQQFGGDVKKVFKLMLKANMTRWTSRSDFSDAACGVKQVANELGYDINKVNRAFNTVQIVPDC